jgi:hypothetical protein
MSKELMQTEADNLEARVRETMSLDARLVLSRKALGS